MPASLLAGPSLIFMPRLWIRLGTKPVYGITVDAVGRFRSGAAPTNVLDVLRQFLIEDMVMPSAYIDAAWTATSSLAPYAGGWFWDGSSSVTGRQAVSTLLSGLGISLVPTRTGTLRPIRLQDPADAGDPVLTLTTDVISAISPVALAVDLGGAVSLQAPVPGAKSAVPGIVVSEHVTSSGNTTTLTILV